MKNNLQKNILFSIICFFSGILLTVIFYSIYNNFLDNKDETLFLNTRLNNKDYKFTNPLITSIYDNENENLKKWFPAERNLKILVQDIVSQNEDLKTSVFFLNLNNSGWFSVNGTETFIPASLLKLPMLMSYYKLREKESDLFEQKILYEGKDFNKLKNIGNGSVVPGKTYSVKELMEEMIINSDNNALQLLYKYRKDSLKLIFEDLAINLPSSDDEISSKNFVTTRDIARFLLVLYNSSYLNSNDSEEALKILSKSAFKDGLVAGIPKDVVVSHKFGERVLLGKDNNPEIELHDCGIVYHPNTPYIVCIMTKGADFDQEKIQIQKISKVIYERVNVFSSN